MPSPRVLLVELEAALSQQVTQRLTDLGVQVATASAADAVKKLLEAPPDLAIVNLELSWGSGFGLVNRVLRMEALSGLELVLVVDNATDAAIEEHKKSATPADAYVKRAEGASVEAFSDAVLEAAQRLLTEPIPEVPAGELTELHDPLERIISELGFRVLRRLRDEDGGAVFACRDDELQRAVAIKLMSPELDRGTSDARDERMQRFERERRILALLHSPHVLAVYGAGTHRGTPYVVRELIDGESLADHIRREGALDVAIALRHVRETALGLQHAAAAGVIHRDVRPENIHVVEDHAKIARFGMGKREDDARITRNGLQPLDDMTYIAPERVRGQEDARGDIYGLGVTLHTLIAGRSPFSTPACVDVVTGKRTVTPVALDDARPGTLVSVASLVSRLMHEDPAQRPQSWDEVLVLLDEAARAVSGESEVSAQPAEEPSAVHGTLRMMSVVEIVQSLELARKTATVSLPTANEPEGKLAFESGRLVHASFGTLRGAAAFFTLVTRKSGAFRVEYEPLSLEPNLDTPLAGLLLEAARREDESARGAPPPIPSATTDSVAAASVAAAIDKAVDNAFLDADVPKTDAVEAAVTPPPVAPPAVAQPRQIASTWGFVAILVVAGLAGFAGLQLSVPSVLPAPSDDDPSARAVTELLAATREELRASREALAAVQPKLAAFEQQQATVASVEESKRARAVEVHAGLELLLQELADRRLALGMADNEVIVEIGELALFTAEGDEVTADGTATLARIAGVLAPFTDVHVRVEGHTDDAEPRGRHRNNWGLSGARAIAVAKRLEGAKAVALADTKPIASTKGPKGRARNRRIELHLTQD